MIAQAAGVDARRHEVVAQRVHLHERGQSNRIAEIVGILALGKRRAGCRLDRDQAHFLADGLVGEKRKRDAAEVGTAATGGQHDVGILTDFFELFFGFQPDHGLMQQHVIEHGTETVIRVFARSRFLDRLGDGDAERARAVGVGRENLAPGLGLVAGAGEDFRPPRLHHGTAERLLLVADLHHVYPHLDAEHLSGEGQRRAPLAGAGFRSEALDARLPVVPRLRHGGVRLVRTGRAHAFVLVIDLRRRAEHLLQPARTVQRARPPQAVDFAHRFRNGNPALAAHLLRDQRLGENRAERLRRHRFAVGAQRGRRRIRHVRDDVVPVGGYFGFVEQNFCFGHACSPG
jgi:hypothetical protein